MVYSNYINTDRDIEQNKSLMKTDMAYNYSGEQRARVQKRHTTAQVTGGRLPQSDIFAVPERIPLHPSHSRHLTEAQRQINNIRVPHPPSINKPNLPQHASGEFTNPAINTRDSGSAGYNRTQNVLAESPALSDISSIHWSRRSSVNSTRQSSTDTTTQCDSSSSPDKPLPARRDAFMNPLKPAKSEFPIRPLPHMIPSDFLASRARNDGSRPSSTATSLRSTVLDFGSRNSSSFSSPRHSARGRKRGLSASPMSEIIDLNDIIRTSPTSLVAFLNCSRTSSAASRTSGSYGHLSAASMSPTPHGMYQYNRSRNPFATPSLPRTPMSSNRQRYDHDQSSTISNPNVSSTTDVTRKISPTSTTHIVDSESTIKINEVKKEEIDQDNTSEATPKGTGDDSDEGEETSEPLELRCQWDACDMLFDTPKQLVLHVNSDHIQKNKKDCTCYWKGCSRARKSFKAMYMLVVHVRRHTGEKPHKCHYVDCDKAYSRLENLKTHLRSHTGERPYACEFEGCVKAFSNASDRAKHQNRTHSSFKQYGCKIPGCSKRYTDPSSLRKHMKTVHGSIPQQPTMKKVKGEKPDKDYKRSYFDKQTAVGQCLTVRPLQRTNSEGNKPSGGYQSSAPVHRGPYVQQPGYSYTNGGNSAPTNNWVAAQQSPTTSTNDMEGIDIRMQQDINHNHGSPRIEERQQMGPSVQAAPRPFLPRISGKPRAQEGLLNGSRRSSNASQGSVDSNYLSGTDSSPPSNTASRRSSEDSLHSFLSSRRSSMASPLPNGLSPRSVEGKILGSTILSQRNTLTPTIPEHVELKHDLSGNDLNCTQPDMIQAQHNNRLSRVSSGYGSQNYYFGCRSPAPPPLDSREVRRASEGTVKRLGDNSASRYTVRRGSEPLPPIHNDILPRRHSLSTYAPLPVPSTMRHTFANGKRDSYDMTFSRQMAIPNPSINMMPSNHEQPPQSNLVIQPMSANDMIGPQFPPSEEELANGSNLFPATSCDNGMMDTMESNAYHMIPTHAQINNNCLSPPQVMEPDSTMDNLPLNPDSYEDLMVQGLGALSTGPVEDGLQLFPPDASSNMAINDMNTLIESLHEENKYFEDKSFRCPIPNNYNFL